MNNEPVLMQLVLPLIVTAMFCGFLRVLRGPTLPDRVVGLDLLATFGIAFLTVWGIATGEAVLIDVGIVLALVAFLGTVAFAYYLQRRTGL